MASSAVGGCSTFVAQLNRVDEKCRLIDTLRREQAGDAFTALAVRAGCPITDADTWFDQWRDF